MNLKIKLALISLCIGLLNHQLAYVVDWFWSDNFQCYEWIQAVCTLGDEYVSKLMRWGYAWILYYIGLWGFTGFTLSYIEEKYLNKVISSVLTFSFDSKGIIFPFLVSWVLMTIAEKIFGLQAFFEYLYTLTH